MHCDDRCVNAMNLFGPFGCIAIRGGTSIAAKIGKERKLKMLMRIDQPGQQKISS